MRTPASILLVTALLAACDSSGQPEMFVVAPDAGLPPGDPDAAPEDAGLTEADAGATEDASTAAVPDPLIRPEDRVEVLVFDYAGLDVGALGHAYDEETDQVGALCVEVGYAAYPNAFGSLGGEQNQYARDLGAMITDWVDWQSEPALTQAVSSFATRFERPTYGSSDLSGWDLGFGTLQEDASSDHFELTPDAPHCGPKYVTGGRLRAAHWAGAQVVLPSAASQRAFDAEFGGVAPSALLLEDDLEPLEDFLTIHHATLTLALVRVGTGQEAVDPKLAQAECTVYALEDCRRWLEDAFEHGRSRSTALGMEPSASNLLGWSIARYALQDPWFAR